ncbi:anaerobic ribonucleoside-triphosphate reductase activating protein [Candidatus Woesearchaeota archaeon]|nr:MAG: anaerobic ribonucleoside-triphosphate reductase activating protein [Candidatus Woesearchaeota archaeon]
MENLLVNGFIKTSMLDYPGKLVSVIFLGRCNFRCGFCHNADMVIRPDEIPRFDIESIFRYLEKKKDWMDGVCVSGGEPTLHKELPELLRKIKEIGLEVKLDSNGTNPEMLKSMIEEGLIDYIAMDIKTSREKYELGAGVKVNMENIQKSIDLIKSSGVDYEFRTTIVPEVVTKEDMEKIAEWLGSDTKRYCLQQFVPMKVIEEKYYDVTPYLKGVLEEMGEIARKIIPEVEVRGV